ncbi:MAG: DNA repair protein RadC [Sandaracinaceae bacterium]|nr:DNA repair protein RadC [Sandaracinaceae bacterium]
MMDSPVFDAPPDGPRERLMQNGAASLSDAELVSVLLATGTHEEPVQVLAARLLSLHGGVASLARAGVGMLASMRGVGIGKATRIAAAIELGRRASIVQPPFCKPVTTSAELHAVLRAHLAWSEVENFFAIPLDAKNRPMGHVRIAQGGVAVCGVSPSDAFRAVVREAAVGVVFAHNHPSGDTTPSHDDIELTIRLCQAGELLGVRVVDHIIVGKESYFSFVDARLLPSRGAP